MEHLLLTLAEAIADADATATKIKKAIDAPALTLLREAQGYLTARWRAYVG